MNEFIFILVVTIWILSISIGWHVFEGCGFKIQSEQVLMMDVQCSRSLMKGKKLDTQNVFKCDGNLLGLSQA